MAVRNLAELGENLQKIMSRLMDTTRNQNLLKLLYYTDKDPLSKEDLTEAMVKQKIYEKLIKITPKYTDDDSAQSAIIIKVNGGRQLADNDEFKDIELSLEVFVPLTQWIIKNSNLRPFAILGEMQKTLDNLTINGLGKLQCGEFRLSMLTDEVSCYTLECHITSYD